MKQAGDFVKKVLIATICDAANTALSEVLSQYEVHICTTGTDALKLIETLRPDILILDLMLPAMDGLTVLRKSGFRPPIILARTNLITPAVLKTAATVGVQDILPIPCTVRYIVERLDALIEKSPSPKV